MFSGQKHVFSLNKDKNWFAADQRCHFGNKFIRGKLSRDLHSLVKIMEISLCIFRFLNAFYNYNKGIIGIQIKILSLHAFKHRIIPHRNPPLLLFA